MPANLHTCRRDSRWLRGVPYGAHLQVCPGATYLAPTATAVRSFPVLRTARFLNRTRYKAA